jgi:uncharacterized membrane protein YwaF
MLCSLTKGNCLDSKNNPIIKDIIQMFTLYSWSHIYILILASFLVFLFSKIKLELSRFSELFIVFFITFLYFAHFFYYLLVHGLHPGYDLPVFQLCGVAGVNLGLFFYFKNGLFYQVVYLLGFTVSILAFLLPDLQFDYMHPYFWMFWIPHFVILSLVSIGSFGSNFELSKKDVNRIFAALVIYLFGFALPLSVTIRYFFGYANYGYTISIPFNFFGMNLEAPYYYPFALGFIYFFFRLLHLIKTKAKCFGKLI